MKKIFLISIMLICVHLLQAQISQEELDSAHIEAKKAKATKKAKEENYANLLEMVNKQNATIAFDEQDFVLEIDKITFRRGNWKYVTPSTNFISLSEGRSTVQIVLDSTNPGQNGIGGVTVEGSVSGLEMSIDKRGTKRISMNVNGVGISAKVDIELPKDSYKATATVSPNLNSNRFIVDGYLYPTSESSIYKGRSF